MASAKFAEYSNAHDELRLLEQLETQHKTSLELAKRDLEYGKTTLADNINLLARISTQLVDLEQRKAELEENCLTFRAEKALCEGQENTFNNEITQHKNAGLNILARRQKNMTDERDVERHIVGAATRAARLQSEINVLREQEIARKQDAVNF